MSMVTTSLRHLLTKTQTTKRILISRAAQCYASTASSYVSNSSSISSAGRRYDGYHNNNVENDSWSDILSFTSADVNLAKLFMSEDSQSELLYHIEKNDEERSGDLLYSLSFATAESDNMSQLLTEQMKEQLSNVKSLRQETIPHVVNHQQSSTTTTATVNEEDTPLPLTLHEALQPSTQARVVTSTCAPFRILHVNDAWEELCGYTAEESVGRTLGCLQGPETDMMTVTALLGQVMKGEEAGCEIVNYDRSGRRFRNRLRVGSLKEGEGDVTHFIGVLKEVKRMEA